MNYLYNLSYHILVLEYLLPPALFFVHHILLEGLIGTRRHKSSPSGLIQDRYTSENLLLFESWQNVLEKRHVSEN